MVGAVVAGPRAALTDGPEELLPGPEFEPPPEPPELDPPEPLPPRPR